MTESILQEALERFRESDEGASEARDWYADDVRFSRLGEQWPEEIKKLRKEENRPCLTINRLPSFIRQVVNDARQNKPAIMVHPVDNGADPDTAEVINGIIRHVERRSNADVAYDTAIDHSASGGFGFIRLGIDYAHPLSFDMECRIHRVSNPLLVHWDVNTTEFDASDWNYAFVSDFLSEDEFTQKYPKAERVSFEGMDSNLTSAWMQEDKTRVAEYWLREFEKKTILLLSNGNVIREDHLTDELKAAMMMSGVQVIRERETDVGKVTRRVISGVEVLSEEEWPGSNIPIAPVWGEEIIIDGERHTRSMTRDARDPQMMFNFWRTASTELVALAPRAPFVGPVGFMKGNEAAWMSANTRSHAALEYAGQVAPQRQAFAGVPAGALQEALNASDDMKAIMGIYDASLGARSNETSGRAILARQRESDVANFHFVDNLSRAIAYLGKCLVEIIPHVYTPETTIRILGEDMKGKVVDLTQKDKNGKLLYDMSVGTYDVTVKAGPSYATQREETREALIEIMRAVPGAAQFIGDIVMEHMDFQGADKVADRLRMLLPPQVQQAEGIAPQMPQVQPNMAGMPPEMPEGMPPMNGGFPGSQ